MNLLLFILACILVVFIVNDKVKESREKNEKFNKMMDEVLAESKKSNHSEIGSDMLQKLKDHLDTPEGMASAKEYFGRINSRKMMNRSQVERFHSKFKDRIDEIMEKLVNKYNSKEYVLREYNKGLMPREDLFWFMMSYAKEHGKKCEDLDYLNEFTVEAYYIGSYVIQEMQGQGSVIKVEKIEEPNTKRITINNIIYIVSTERVKGKCRCLCMVDDEMYGEVFEYDGRFDEMSDEKLKESGLMDETYRIIAQK